MSYADMVRDALAKGEAKDISFTIFRFEKTGDTLKGELIGWETIQIPRPDNPNESSDVIQYRIMSDEGPKCVVMGFSGDKALKDSGCVNGDVLAITFMGQKDMGKGGRRVNI